MSQAGIVEIAKNFFLYRSPEKDFHRNIYLKQFVGDNRTINMIFDPGTKQDMGQLFDGIGKIIGSINNFDVMFLSHQDPDVSSNAPSLMSCSPRSILLTSVDTWRLVNMYGLPEKRFVPVERYEGQIMRIKSTGHQIKVVPARYCHFRGSMMVYDLESRTLFTGDFLGGVNSRKDTATSYLATEESWEGISLFHQLYMPSSKAMQYTLELISALDPFPEVIAPQHGDVITGELILKFIGRLSNLKVGIDYMVEENVDRERAMLAINNFLSFIHDKHDEKYGMLIEHMSNLKDFSKTIILRNGKVRELKVSPTVAFQQLYSLVGELQGEHGNLQQEFLLQSISDMGLSFIPADKDKENFTEGNEDVDTMLF